MLRLITIILIFTFTLNQIIWAVPSLRGTSCSGFAYVPSGLPLVAVSTSLRHVSFVVKTFPVCHFAYDQNSNVTTITPPEKPDHVFEYNDTDLESSYNPPNIGLPEHSTLYSYTLDKELENITRPDGQEIDFIYNDRGLLTLLTYPNGLLDYTYEEATGKLMSVSTGTGETLAYTYDGSLLLSTGWSGTFNHTLERTYDNFFRVESQTLGGTAIDFQYDDDSLLVTAGTLSLTRDPLNGLITSTYLEGINDGVEDIREYNAFGEIASYIAQYGANTVASFNYTRDSLGRITQKVETVNGTTNTFDYTYDLTGRLTDVSKNGVNISHYEFDSNGNRTLATLSEGVFSATYDDQDRLLSAVIPAQAGTLPFSYTYSANGELQSKTNTVTNETTSYVYDVLGNLLSVALPDGTLIEYLIDGQNRRIGKKINGVLTKGWLYQDSLNPIAELDGSGNIVSRFVYGSWPYCPDYMIKNGEAFRIVQDHLGSPRVIVNANTGIIAQELSFDEYGNILQDTAQGFQPFGFAGGLYDPDTGLIRFGARDYDSTTGRWTAKDPIGFNGGMSFYVYVENDPINYLDPLGLGKIGFCIRTVKNIWKKVTKERALTALEKGKDVKVTGPKGSKTANQMADKVFGNKTVRHNPHRPSEMAHYQHKNGGKGHVFYSNLSTFTATGIFGNNLLTQTIDLFNPISDLVDLMELFDENNQSEQECEPCS